MGTEEQWQNEWIELYNPTDIPISLDGWKLKAKDDNPTIELSGIIKKHSYFLLERTDDTTVPKITAEQIFKGGLSNNGETLFLLNNFDEIIDEIDCSLGWFAGNNETKKTMERIDPLAFGSHPSNWKTSQKAGGTPQQENSPNKKIENKKELGTTFTTTNSSNFFFNLTIASVLSLFFSMLVVSIWLKIKEKRNKIKKNY